MILADHLNLHTVIVGPSQVVKRETGDDLARIRVGPHVTPGTGHAEFFSVRRNKHQRIGWLAFLSKDLCQVSQNGDSRSIVIGFLAGRHGDILVSDHQDFSI